MKVFCYGCQTEEETDWLVRCPKCETKGIGIEEDLRDFLELNRHLAGSPRQSLPGPQIEGHAGPTPILNETLHRDIGFGRAIRIHAVLPTIAGNG